MSCASIEGKRGSKILSKISQSSSNKIFVDLENQHPNTAAIEKEECVSKKVLEPLTQISDHKNIAKEPVNIVSNVTNNYIFFNKDKAQQS